MVIDIKILFIFDVLFYFKVDKMFLFIYIYKLNDEEFWVIY